MKIALLWSGPTRLWHRRLAERLGSAGHVLVVREGRAVGTPRGLDSLRRLERMLYGVEAELFAPAVVSKPAAEAPDDLLIEPVFDGEPGEAALIAALLRGQAPSVAIQRFMDGVWTDLVSGLPAIEEPDVLARGLDQVAARLIALVCQAVRAVETGQRPHPVSEAGASSATPSLARFAARGFANKVKRRLGAARGRPDHWRIATRALEPGLVRAPWGRAGFVPLPDDGLRFQADPFLFERGGRTHLFFEDFPYATRKGVIARVEIDASGDASLPRTVLEQPVHLSYPFVLAHGDAVYMLPEMSAARRIQLFRAEPFPDRWVADRILVEDVVAGDATPILHGGRCWLFATLSGDGGSSWDQLGLFYAPDLLGPWTAHPGNPVLIDAGAARPAGAMWHEDGVLMRVAQDCRAGYGAGLAICRVDRLDLDGYAQTVVARRAPPAGLGANGVHTLNRAGSFETIDLKLPHANGRAV